MVQAVNQRGRSPWSPSGQPHMRRYLFAAFCLFVLVVSVLQNYYDKIKNVK